MYKAPVVLEVGPYLETTLTRAEKAPRKGAGSLLFHKLSAEYCGNGTVFASAAKQSRESKTYHEVTEIAASLRSSR